MHQPDYRDLRDGTYHMPWTYLHTIKDYVDMVEHLENYGKVKAVVNFAPVLLEQIDDYAQQLEGYLNHGSGLRDPLLSALAEPVMLLDNENRLKIIRSCLRSNKQRMIDRFDAYKTLSNMAETAQRTPEILGYYSEQFFADILVWYHLAWTAETVRMTDERIKTLMEKAINFDIHDRHILVEVISDLMSGVIERYRKLAVTGRIELSMTPYAHPIVPLLIDLKSAKQAVPEIEFPRAEVYPYGLERSRWHMQKGKEVFRHYFGFEPQGCWPSEGSISAETIKLMSEAGIKWLASGETVLRNSLKKSKITVDDCIHQAYQYSDTSEACFFRDDELSDSIGFIYSDWHAEDAVANLIHKLEKIADCCADKPEAVVSIILDGENAWEYYPLNGYYFITSLYEMLSQHKRLTLTTYSNYLAEHNKRKHLSNIVAGSWVHGTFSTWIGEKDKNRAWDMLIEAKKAYDTVINAGKLPKEKIKLAEIQLATCESSDWFWWFGENNSAESVRAFDKQFRLHLCNLYQLLKVEPPDYLATAFSFGSKAGETLSGGTMLPGQSY